MVPDAVSVTFSMLTICASLVLVKLAPTLRVSVPHRRRAACRSAAPTIVSLPLPAVIESTPDEPVMVNPSRLIGQIQRRGSRQRHVLDVDDLRVAGAREVGADVERVGAAAAVEHLVVLGAHDRVGASVADDVVVARAAGHRRAASRLIDDDRVAAGSGIQCERAGGVIGEGHRSRTARCRPIGGGYRECTRSE